MTQHGDNDTQGLELDRYGDGDETTLRRDPGAGAELDPYEEEEAITAPWIRRN